MLSGLHRRFFLMICIAIVVLVYWASLTWVFPGEFHPLTPHHPDIYEDVGLLSRPALEVASFPRPVTFLFYRTAGYLGIGHALIFPIAAMFGAVLLAPFAVERISGERPSLLAFLAYVILLFTHPQFYFHHRHDGTAGLATLLVFLTLMAVVSWLRTPAWKGYVWALSFVALMALSKETYLLSMPLLAGGLCLSQFASIRWKRVLLLLGGIGAVEAIILAYDTSRFLHYAGPIPSGSTYASDLHPASIFAVFRHYLADGLSPAAVACCLIALIALLAFARWRPHLAIMPLGFALAGLLALLPNAILPRHYEGQYAWNVAPLLFAVILFVPSSKAWSIAAQAAVLVLAIFSIRANATVYHSEPLQWILGQERANVRIVKELPEIRARIAGAHHVLLTGLTVSLHPWEAPDFLRQYFGRDLDWTVVITGDLAESVRPNLAMLKPGSVRLAEYDGAVLLHSDGELQDVLAGSAFRRAIVETPEAVLIPSVATAAAALKTKPDDFSALLHLGVEVLTWGLPDRALPVLERASRVAPANPYPWFFMGQAERDLKEYESARAAYLKAIAASGRDVNPAFTQALSTLPGPGQHP